MPDNTQPLTGGGGFPPDNPDGTPGLIGKDDFTRQLEIERANRRPVTALAGNFADLQRLGSEAANNNAVEGVVAPPGVDPAAKNVVTPAQAESARGEFTRETERTGLIDAPVAPTPPENRSPNPVDPTSTSPQAISRAATTPTKK